VAHDSSPAFQPALLPWRRRAILAAGAAAAGPRPDAEEEATVGYVERHLLPNEQVIYKTKLHWILFAKPALVTLLGLVLTVTLGALVRVEWLWYLGLLVIVAGLVWGAIHAVELLTSEFAVTTTRLIFKVGLVGRFTMELLLGKVESIGVQQTLVGRLLNYGDLVVTGTGGAREVFRRVGDPIGFRNHVQQASLRALAPEHGQG
jgi:uncharacterized membrane protein YdbT with pleckstrin-like domain